MIIIISTKNREKVNIGSCVSVAKNSCTTCAHRKSEYLMTKYIIVRNVVYPGTRVRSLSGDMQHIFYQTGTNYGSEVLSSGYELCMSWERVASS